MKYRQWSLPAYLASLVALGIFILPAKEMLKLLFDENVRSFILQHFLSAFFLNPLWIAVGFFTWVTINPKQERLAALFSFLLHSCILVTHLGHISSFIQSHNAPLKITLELLLSHLPLALIIIFFLGLVVRPKHQLLWAPAIGYAGGMILNQARIFKAIDLYQWPPFLEALTDPVITGLLFFFLSLPVMVWYVLRGCHVIDNGF